MRSWQEGLQPITDQYLNDLTNKGFADAKAVHAELVKTLKQEP